MATDRLDGVICGTCTWCVDYVCTATRPHEPTQWDDRCHRWFGLDGLTLVERVRANMRRRALEAQVNRGDGET